MSTAAEEAKMQREAGGFKGRLVMLNLLTAGIALVIAVGILMVQQYFANRRDVGEQIEAMAQITADNAAAALAFGDASSAAETLGSLRSMPEVTRAGVYGPKGMLHAWHRSDVPDFAFDVTLAPNARALRFSVNRVEVYKPALLAGRPVGMVFVQADLRRVYYRLAWFAAAALLVIVVALAGAFALLSRARNRIAEAEDAVHRVNVELEHRVAERTAELERANRELESFSYSVSHDLRAPLRAINGFSQIVQESERERLTGEGRKLLDRITANAERMGQLIDDILAYSRASQAHLERAPVDLEAMARGIAHEAAEHYPGAHYEIHQLPRLMGDRTMLHQVLQNLIGNAFKYSSKTAEPRIEVSAHRQKESWVISVRDNGAGFDMAYSERLFGMFQRMHAESEFPGTGVGLAIVKRLIERHGGTIWCESQPGRGANFFFTLGEGS